jgi:hypothetical protein
VISLSTINQMGVRRTGTTMNIAMLPSLLARIISFNPSRAPRTTNHITQLYQGIVSKKNIVQTSNYLMKTQILDLINPYVNV